MFVFLDVSWVSLCYVLVALAGFPWVTFSVCTLSLPCQDILDKPGYETGYCYDPNTSQMTTNP